MAKTALLVIGLIIVGVVYFLTATVTPQQIVQAKTGLALCNSPIGTVGSLISGSTAQNCENMRMLSMFLPIYTYRFPLYAIGLLLIVFGIFAGGSQPQVIVRNIKNRATNPMQMLAGHKFCHSCGEQIPDSSAFCKFCGTKLD